MKSSRDIIVQRQKNILLYLQKAHGAEVSELSGRFNVTTATIRRDLEELERQGCVQRYFGGAKSLIPPNIDVQYQTPLGNPTPSRIAIAKKAAAMISSGDTVFLNSSSTALYILDHLGDINASFITNNGRALYANHRDGIDLLLTGGEIYGNKQSLVGEFAVSSLKKVTASKCFLGASGVSTTGGITSSIIQEVAVNQHMIAQCSGPKVIVADSSKIGVRQNFFSFGLEEVTHLITDSDADHDELERIRACGVEIIIADAE